MHRPSFSASYAEHRRWILLGIGSLLFLISMFYRMCNAVISPLLADEFHLSPDELGLLTALFFWTFAFFQIPLGFVLDRFGTKTVMAVLSVIGSAGSIFFAQSTALSELLIGRALLGLGMSCNFIANLKILADWFPADRFATLSGIIIAFGTLGSVMATSPLVIMVNAVGWRGSFWLIGMINLFLGFAFFLIAKNSPYGSRSGEHLKKEGKANASFMNGVRNLFGDYNFWAIAWSSFVRYGTYGAIQALWAGPFLMSVINLSPLVAGNLIFVFNIGFMLGSPFMGFLSDRIFRSRKKVVVAGLIILALSELIMAFSRSTNLIWWGLVFFMMGCGSSNMQIMLSHIKELMPHEMAGRSMAATNFFNMMGPGVFLYVFGKVLSSFGSSSSDEGYKIGFLLCFFSVSIAITMYMKTRDSMVRRQEFVTGHQEE